MEIKSNPLLVRIRPQRIAVLINEHLNYEKILKLINFLSLIWGGRYTVIIDVNECDNGESAKNKLAQIRPELIYAIDIDYSKWKKICQQCCQSRIFRHLSLIDEEVEHFIKLNPDGIIWAKDIVKGESIEHPLQNRKNLKLFKINANNKISTFFSASFGYLSDKAAESYASYLNSDISTIDDRHEFSKLLSYSKGMGKFSSWLDFASIGLIPLRYHNIASLYSPTVIVVKEDDPASDLSLFWNLRMQFSIGASQRIILFSNKEVENSNSVSSLIEWLELLPGSNKCELISQKCKKPLLDSLARRIRARLKKSKTQVRHVDVKDNFNEVPLIIPYDEHKENLITTPFIPRNIVMIEGTTPYYHKYLPFNSTWICDLLKDIFTNRRPFDLSLPCRNSVINIINAQDSTDLGFGPGSDSLNLKMHNINPRVSFLIPSQEEIFEAILIESNLKPNKDEKRIRYLATIEIFGGLDESAKYLSGLSLKLIKSFRVKKGNHVPKYERLSLNGIKSKIHISKEEKSDVKPILNNLVEKGVLKRMWILKNCTYCDKDYWLYNLDLQKSLFCPGCLKKRSLPSEVEIGYELNELVKLAIDEGIIPVILTGRFLKNITHKGFSWLPGVKYKQGDFDILASCDGYLVAVECKSLNKVKKNNDASWETIYDQIKSNIEDARQIGVKIYFLASMCEKYPRSFKEEIRELSDSSLKIFLLNKENLMNGELRISIKGKSKTFTTYDIFPEDDNIYIW